MKYFIIAQPKSGIHLCGNLFTELGIKSSNYLLRKEQSLKYNKASWNTQMNLTNGPIVNDKGWPVMLDVLQNDTFTLLQSIYSDELYNKIKNYKIVYINRGYEDIKKSAKNMNKSAGLDVKVTKNILKQFDDWKKVSTIFHLTFDDLVNSNIEIIDNLQYYLYNRIGIDSKTAIQKALAKPSPTKSSLRG